MKIVISGCYCVLFALTPKEAGNLKEACLKYGVDDSKDSAEKILAELFEALPNSIDLSELDKRHSFRLKESIQKLLGKVN